VKREILFAEVFDKLEAYGDIKGILEFGSERMPNCCSLRIEDSPQLAAESFK